MAYPVQNNSNATIHNHGQPQHVQQIVVLPQQAVQQQIVVVVPQPQPQAVALPHDQQQPQPSPQQIGLRIQYKKNEMYGKSHRYKPRPYEKHPDVKCPFLQLTQIGIFGACKARYCADMCCDYGEDGDDVGGAGATMNNENTQNSDVGDDGWIGAILCHIICPCFRVIIAFILVLLAKCCDKFCCCLCKAHCKEENRKCCLPCDIFFNVLLCIPRFIYLVFLDLFCIAWGLVCIALDPLCCILSGNGNCCAWSCGLNTLCCLTYGWYKNKVKWAKRYSYKPGTPPYCFCYGYAHHMCRDEGDGDPGCCGVCEM